MEQTMTIELVQGIIDTVQNVLMRIVLYGSFARETQTEESDIDIAILIQGSMNKETEERLSDFIVDMNLKYDKVFSVVDIDYDNFRKWETVLPFYRNVNKEGVVLWQAA